MSSIPISAGAGRRVGTAPGRPRCSWPSDRPTMPPWERIPNSQTPGSDRQGKHRAGAGPGGPLPRRHRLPLPGLSARSVPWRRMRGSTRGPRPGSCSTTPAPEPGPRFTAPSLGLAPAPPPRPPGLCPRSPRPAPREGPCPAWPWASLHQEREGPPLTHDTGPVCSGRRSQSRLLAGLLSPVFSLLPDEGRSLAPTAS